MSEVTLRIGGRPYKVACADGEEAQLARLGSMVDAKFKQLSGNRAPTEAQNLLFAALLLADELHELHASLGEDPEKIAARMGELEQAAKTAGDAEREARLELEALRAEHKTLAEELANLKSAANGQEALFSGDGIAARLERLADAVEKCAQELESRVSAP